MKFFFKSRVLSALENRDRGALDRLFDQEDINTRVYENNGTALHFVADKGVEGMVEYLAAKGVDVNATDSYSWTALHHAVYKGRFNLVVELLRAGADPNLRTVEGRNAYGWATLREHPEVAEILQPYMKKVTETVDLPPPPGGEEETREPAPVEWKKLSGEKIARVTVEPGIGYRITEIFNFAAQERTTLYRNLETGAESVETRSFLSMEGRKDLEEALEELQKQGGKADASHIGGLAKKRLAP